MHPSLTLPSHTVFNVPGSASPLGTVFSNQSLFSIQGTRLPRLANSSISIVNVATNGVYHPNRNGTFIKIYNKANPLVPAWQADCGYSPDCIYSGQTILFRVQNPSWIPGANYYVLFDSGAASGNVFCAPESAAITGNASLPVSIYSPLAYSHVSRRSDPKYWNFNIWNPALSSTTTTSTTPPTTATVTTRVSILMVTLHRDKHGRIR